MAWRGFRGVLLKFFKNKLILLQAYICEWWSRKIYYQAKNTLDLPNNNFSLSLGQKNLHEF